MWYDIPPKVRVHRVAVEEHKQWLISIWSGLGVRIDVGHYGVVGHLNALKLKSIIG